MARPSRGELLQLVAGALLILISFIPWWGSYASLSPDGHVIGRGDLDGWGSYGFAANLALLLTLSTILLILSRAIGIDLDVPRREMLYPALAAATLALLFAVLVGGPVPDVPGRGEEHDVSRGPLAYVSLGLAAIVFYGAVLHRSERSTPETKEKPGRTTHATNTSRGIDGAR